MKKSEDAAAKKKPKTSAAQIRVQKGQSLRQSPAQVIVLLTRAASILDLTELDLPSTMKTDFPNPADLLNFSLTISPDEGTYPGHSIPLRRSYDTNTNVYKACIKAERSHSHSLSTRTTRMTRQKSNASPR